MARPTKSARVLTQCSQTKDEINARIENEEKLKGRSEVCCGQAFVGDVERFV